MDLSIRTGECVEFVTKEGTFIGVLLSADKATNSFIVEDVMKINLTPVPAENGQGFMLIPKLDLLNYYSIGKEFEFDLSSIIYCSVVTGSKFVDGYKQQYKMYEQMKIQQGSNIEVVSANAPINGIKTT